MRPDDLHSFITLLEQADQLVRIPASVDPHLEAATIIDIVCKGADGGRGLLFTDVKGSTIPVVANLFGNRQRIAWALGTTDLCSLAERLCNDLHSQPHANAGKAVQYLCSRTQIQPVAGEDLCCLDVTESGLTRLPILKFWPGDGGRYITFGQVLTADLKGRQNCGMYRLQVLDGQRAAIHLKTGAGAARHLHAWHSLGRSMPIAIVLGGPPALTWAAGLPLPAQVDEASFVGYLTGRPLPFAACRHSALKAPARAEIVIEGEIAPGEVAMEGPFGNHVGRYTEPAPQPVVRVKAIRARPEAIYPTTMVGPPPMENLGMAEVAVQLLLPMLRHEYPWISSLYMPAPGIYHRGAMIAVAQDCDLSLDAIGHCLAKTLLLRNARLLVLFDADASLTDPAELYWRIINTDNWRSRCRVSSGRLLLDARRPGDWAAVRPDSRIQRQVLCRWAEFGLQP